MARAEERTSGALRVKELGQLKLQSPKKVSHGTKRPVRCRAPLSPVRTLDVRRHFNPPLEQTDGIRRKAVFQIRSSLARFLTAERFERSEKSISSMFSTRMDLPTPPGLHHS